MPIAYKKLSDISDLAGKRVLLRLDLNVPIVNGEVRDDFRIKKSIPTLKMLREKGARTIVIAHLESEAGSSLERVAEYISKSVELKAFIATVDAAPPIVTAMQEGDIVMIENLRKDPGEKGNSPVFAKKLASLADIYVNDAFSVSHREHASIVGVPKILPSYAGPLISDEIENLSMAFEPKRPFFFILGGAKFDTKLPLIEKFLDIADNVFVGGALSNDIYKEKGFEVGKSLVAKAPINLKHLERNPKLMVPSDVIAVTSTTRELKSPDMLKVSESILDAGPKTVGEIADILSETAFVLWNGPLGDYEHGYVDGTVGVAKAIIESGAISIIGGGDTIAVVAKAGLLDKFTFVSTGGGAMLDFLAKGTLPGIEALKGR